MDRKTSDQLKAREELVQAFEDYWKPGTKLRRAEEDLPIVVFDRLPPDDLAIHAPAIIAAICITSIMSFFIGLLIGACLNR